ncbi:Amidohydrolase_family protein [Hexamita inflata]|uniref:Amidohydrolase family protein n=1 Tax=Hexamita inflata TaxID=28002 RepID=A0AA86TVJ2_9EUKA|nr:Amidohydrolase family protein [Hexamita inflata]
MTTIIHNATFVTLNAQDEVFVGALAYNEKEILAYGTLEEMVHKFPTSKLIDADERVVFPGFVNAHGHYYGMFSRGMDTKDAPAKNFEEVLQRLWFRLDRCLDENSTRSSAEVCLMDALSAGTTTIIDHHASPNYVLGSLKCIYDSCKKAGIRSSLCYEVTDRNGEQNMIDGVQENLDFMEIAVAEQKKQLAAGMTPDIQAQFGLHALLTVSDATLERCNKMMKEFIAKHGHHGGFHVHVAEGTADQIRSVERTGQRVVKRLIEKLFNGIDQKKTIIAHCIDLSDEEIEQLSKLHVNIAHNPGSNMNNAVGVTKVQKMQECGIRVCLGTDGMNSDMVMEHKNCYLIHKHNQKDPQAFSIECYNLLKNNGQLATELFGGKKIGVLEVGAVSDIVITKYRNPTPMNRFNVPWHLMFGVQPGCAWYTICQGKTLVKEGQIQSLDCKSVQKEAQAECPKVWARLDGIIADDKKKM